MFDVLIKQYGDVVSRSEDMIVKQICAEVETELKPYFAGYVMAFRSKLSCVPDN